MDKALYVAMTGASATLKAQSAVANNLANIDTTGFKAALVQTEAYAVQGPGLPSRVDATLKGPGFDASPGPLIQTGNELDVAVRDGHWLVVMDAAGQEAYTRAGSLQINANGQLVTASGLQVMGQGGPISVPPNQSVTLAADGTLSIVPAGQSPATQAQVGRVRVVQADGAALVRGGDGLMRMADGSTPPNAAGNVLTTGVLEGSNVNAAQSLVEMIELSRQFDMQVRVLHSADENARAANSLLRLG